MRQLAIARQRLLPPRVAQIDPAVEVVRACLLHDAGD
jgi:hypothetical protein